jgi:hypothetical protein
MPFLSLFSQLFDLQDRPSMRNSSIDTVFRSFGFVVHSLGDGTGYRMREKIRNFALSVCDERDGRFR